MNISHLIREPRKYDVGYELNKPYCVDSTEAIKSVKDDSIHLIITSPPYDDIYDYDKLNSFETLAREFYRILVPGGVVVWVIGDQFVKGSRTLTSHKQAIYFKEVVGFKVYDVMIYQKHNFSNPMKKRYHNIYEFMYIFSKGWPRVFNPIKDRKNKYAGQTCWGRNTYRLKDGTLGERGKPVNAEYGMRYNIWKINSGRGFTTKDDIAHKHPAIFPEALVRDHIISWTNVGDVVFDPLAGSGTVGKVAHVLDRKFLLFEINQEYHDNIIVPRLKEYGCM